MSVQLSYRKKTNLIARNLLPVMLSAFCILSFAGCSKDSSTDTADLVGDWKKSSEFEGVGRTEAVSFTINNVAYIGGGYDGALRRNDFWSFDQATGTWHRIADFPGTARNSAAAFAIGNKGYVGTGFDDNDNKLNDFWEYNPATNAWTRKADFAGSARYNAVGFAVNDKGYISTGYDGNYLKDLWQYDPATDAWAQKASFTGSKRSDAAVFVYNNIAYVLSGLNNGSYLNDMWAYDPNADAWTEKRKLTAVSTDDYDDLYTTITRSNAVAFVIGAKAYLSLGSYSGVTGATWEYDIATDLWIQKTVFEGTAREGAVAFSINNRGYIACGSNSSYKFDDLWEFYPANAVDATNN